MLFSQAVDYALRATAYLAALPEGTVATRTMLAKQTRLSESFLAKVMRKLVTARIVVSHPGVGGGFTLRLRADQISLMQVVEAVDGTSCLGACLVHSEPCGQRSWCGLHSVLAGAKAEMVSALRSTSVAQIAQQRLTNKNAGAKH